MMLPLMMDLSTSDNFTPRDSEVELFESAKSKNTIACLKADLGKMFVAVMLIREKAFEVCSSPLQLGGFSSVYITPTVKLALQRSAYLRHHTPLKVGIFHEKKGVIKWSCQRWKDELGKSQVLVMTYQVFLEAIQKDFLEMSKLNLLILDDCHNVMNDEALKKILALYEKSANSLHPRILGLTASIVNNICKPMELSQLITILENKLQSAISTSNNVLSALQHSTRPKELVCEISSKPEATRLELEIMDRVQQLSSYLRDHRYD
ncbi:putative Endoribonuclease Dcr-1, partial [Daphnia magna]